MEKEKKKKQGKVEIRPDLEDASRGKDLSYLNEMPQMAGYEGVKAGVPPPKEEAGKPSARAEERDAEASAESLSGGKGKPIGHRVWAIAEGYIPGYSHGPEPQLESHETVCILNASDEDAHVELFLYFSDKDPVGPYTVTVPANRVKHLRFNDLTDPEPVPKDTDYACVIHSDQPIVVQHTRLDSRQAENALLSTMAFPVG